ncbi:MAG: hypothetical protein ACYC0X_13095 [Pirellulaceae bacterium]
MDSSTEFTIDRIDLGTGWVCFQAGDNAPPPDRLPGYLSQTLCTWLQRNPKFVVRATLPIMVAGSTVAVHVWFD